MYFSTGAHITNVAKSKSFHVYSEFRYPLQIGSLISKKYHILKILIIWWVMAFLVHLEKIAPNFNPEFSIRTTFVARRFPMPKAQHYMYNTSPNLIRLESIMYIDISYLLGVVEYTCRPKIPKWEILEEAGGKGEALDGNSWRRKKKRKRLVGQSAPAS